MKTLPELITRDVMNNNKVNWTNSELNAATNSLLKAKANFEKILQDNESWGGDWLNEEEKRQVETNLNAITTILNLNIFYTEIQWS